MDDTDLPDFKGKIVVFYTRNAPRAIQDGIVLEYISFSKYDNKVFLNGKIPSLDSKISDWTSALKAGIAWEDISHYVIFNSKEDYINCLGNTKESILSKIFNK